MAGLCIQLKPDKATLPGARPDLQVYFIGFEEFHAARLQVTEYIESHFPREADDILMAFHEAAGNALRHGSAQRPIFVRIRDYPGHMSIRVSDSGRGFDSANYIKGVEMSLEERVKGVLDSSGRGIGIMSECMDLVRYSKSGNDVLLIKRISRYNSK